MRFHSKILSSGKAAAGIPVPAEIVASLGNSKRLKVRVTINGYSYRSSVAPLSGEFMLPISVEHRTNAGLAAGDEVDIDIELDNEPREVTVPPDFAEALDREADARRFYDGLSYSHKLRYVLWIEEAKTTETRQRRITQSVSRLREGRR